MYSPFFAGTTTVEPKAGTSNAVSKTGGVATPATQSDGHIQDLPNLHDRMSKTKRRYVASIMREKASNPQMSHDSYHLLGCKASFPPTNNVIPQEDPPDIENMKQVEWDSDGCLRAKRATCLYIGKLVKEQKNGDPDQWYEKENRVADLPVRTPM